MKIIIGLFIFFMACSCSQQGKMKDIKDNILYKDQQGNIYLKREIDIMNEKNSQNNQSRFFDLVFYKDSTYQLKNIVDIKTFHFVKSITDTIPAGKFDVFRIRCIFINFNIYLQLLQKFKRWISKLLYLVQPIPEVLHILFLI